MRAGTILLLGREFEAAATRAELALKVDARHVPAHILLGNAKAGLNDTTQAMRKSRRRSRSIRHTRQHGLRSVR